jgi:hypothetical protein
MSDHEHNSEDDALDDLDAEVVEDLDVDEDAKDIEGGTLANTGACPLR